MTKLDAVNRVLRAVGQAGVIALNTDGVSEAAQAERIIDDEELMVQSRGWNYNTRVADLSPNVNDKIPVPTGAIWIDSTEGDEYRNIIHLAGFLYDADENTDIFDAAVRCQYVLRYAFECIPYPIRNWIADRAAKTFNDNHTRNFTDRAMRARVLEQNELRSRAEAFRYDNSSKDSNILKTQDAMRIKGYRAPVPVVV